MYSSKFNNRMQILPQNYKPTKVIEFCGNKISNYKFLIEDNGFYPILIGKGEIPRIWLFAKSQYDEILTLIDDSVSSLNHIKVDIQNSKKKIEVKDIPSGIVILKLEYSKSFEIKEINLNPVGYKIFGTESRLAVGDTILSENSFEGADTIISFNKAKKRSYAAT